MTIFRDRDIMQIVEQPFNYMKGQMIMEEQPVCSCEIIHADAIQNAAAQLSDSDTYIALATLFKLFGDGTRVRILHALALQELCVCDLAALLGLTKSAVSHQLKSLRLARLVKFRRDGQIVYYSLADDHVKKILDMGFEHIRE